jgi:hypothetical protein
MITSGIVNALEPPDHQHVDEQQHDREGDAEVAEDLDGHLPFAVPLDRGSPSVSAAPRCSARS